jgi:hypothetical protein
MRVVFIDERGVCTEARLGSQIFGTGNFPVLLPFCDPLQNGAVVGHVEDLDLVTKVRHQLFVQVTRMLGHVSFGVRQKTTARPSGSSRVGFGNFPAFILS